MSNYIREIEVTKITNVLGVGDECGSVVTLRERIVPSFARVGAFVHFVL